MHKILISDLTDNQVTILGGRDDKHIKSCHKIIGTSQRKVAGPTDERQPNPSPPMTIKVIIRYGIIYEHIEAIRFCL